LAHGGSTGRHPLAARCAIVMRRHPYIAAIGAVVVAIAVLELIGPTVNGATAAQLLLLVILADARFCGTRPASLASLIALLGFLRYFVTPKGFAFGDPNDIAALAAFIIMAVVGGELAIRAEKRAREIEELYRRLQEAFERESEAEAARRSERMKAALLDAMAHNLRTPLTAIKAAATAMVRNAPAHDMFSADQQRDLLAVIVEESDRLDRFIGGLIAPAVSEQAPRGISQSLVDDVLNTAARRAETLTRDHRVIVDVDRSIPPVAVDAAAIAEVVYMLLDNASKYAPPHTTIRVAATRQDSRSVAVRVVDEGPGIPSELRQRVFDRFFQIPNRESHDRRRAGGGVGLALARQLVETQGGMISIEEPPSHPGTAVVLVLPISSAEDAG
jgi:K+-sensing histidine kinase KdpD